jgi:hypothetical protein
MSTQHETPSFSRLVKRVSCCSRLGRMPCEPHCDRPRLQQLTAPLPSSRMVTSTRYHKGGTLFSPQPLYLSLYLSLSRALSLSLLSHVSLSFQLSPFRLRPRPFKWVADLSALPRCLIHLVGRIFLGCRSLLVSRRGLPNHFALNTESTQGIVRRSRSRSMLEPNADEQHRLCLG